MATKDEEEVIETFKKTNFFTDELSWEHNENKNDLDNMQNSYEEVLQEEKLVRHEEDTIKMIFDSFIKEVEHSGLPICEYITEGKIKKLLDLLDV
jgi:hypothetical protein